MKKKKKRKKKNTNDMEKGKKGQNRVKGWKEEWLSGRLGGDCCRGCCCGVADSVQLVSVADYAPFPSIVLHPDVAVVTPALLDPLHPLLIPGHPEQVVPGLGEVFVDEESCASECWTGLHHTLLVLVRGELHQDLPRPV